MFSSEITELSITRENASAIPPRIIVFTVPPIRASTTNAASADRGMERTSRCGAEASQKDEDHQAGKNQSEKTLLQYRAYCLLHVHGLVKDNAGGHLLRDVVEVLDQLADTIHYRDGVGIAALLHDGNVDGFLAVNSYNVGLNPVSVLRFPHVIHRHPGVSFDLERNLAQLIHVVNQAVGVNEVVVRSHLHIARGQDQVGIVDRAHHVHKT